MRTDVNVCVYLQGWARLRFRLPALDGLPEVTLPKRGDALLLVTPEVQARLDRDEQFGASCGGGTTDIGCSRTACPA